MAANKQKIQLYISNLDCDVKFEVYSEVKIYE